VVWGTTKSFPRARAEEGATPTGGMIRGRRIQSDVILEPVGGLSRCDGRRRGLLPAAWPEVRTSLAVEVEGGRPAHGRPWEDRAATPGRGDRLSSLLTAMRHGGFLRPLPQSAVRCMRAGTLVRCDKTLDALTVSPDTAG